MLKSAKKLISLFLAVTLVAMCFAVMNVSAQTYGRVKVIVKNETFSTADSAPWSGVLCSDFAELDGTSTVMTVVEDVFKRNDISYSFNSYNYLSEVNGLSEYAANGSGGWMITLNDWFTAESAAAYTTANGGLAGDDTICVLYTCAWGGDVGSLWGDSTTSLKSLTVGGASLDEPFSPSDTEYTLYIDSTSDSAVTLIPEAVNKNYQVKTYINEYMPAAPGSEEKPLMKPLSLSDGDTVYIGVGNENWATMNEKAKETVYKLNVVFKPQTGDVDLNGIVNIDDATLIQKYLAKFTELSDAQLAAADVNADGIVTIDDATAVQKILAKY